MSLELPCQILNANNSEDRYLLQFIDSNVLSDAAKADIFLSAGTLQYMDTSLPEILAGLEQRPVHVFIHNLPVHKFQSLWTLQSLHACEVHFKINSLEQLNSEMAELDYKLVMSWSNSRCIEIPFHLDMTIEGYMGFYFR